MTISSTTASARFAGNGATTAFPFAFKFLDNTHIVATLLNADGTTTAWIENTHYTLTGAGSDAGGTLTAKASPTDYTPASGTYLTIQRIVPLTQALDLPVGGAFPSGSVESALDLLAMSDQQLDNALNRSLVAPATDAAADLTLPALADRAGMFLAFDADGRPIAADGTTETPVSSFMALVLLAATAKAAVDTLEIHGATVASGATGYTMASTTGRIFVFASTAAGQIVALPAATALPAGERRKIRNNGWFAFAISDGAGGTLIAALAPGQKAVIELEDNSTPAGTWDVRLDGSQPGDIKAIAAATHHGWVEAAGTIGDASSGATRANADTWALFWTIWTNFANTEAAILDSGGSASTRGASASADFAAHKRLPVPDVRGRALVGLDTMAGSAAGRIGTVLTSALGSAAGSEQVTLSYANFNHKHKTSHGFDGSAAYRHGDGSNNPTYGSEIVTGANNMGGSVSPAGGATIRASYTDVQNLLDTTAPTAHSNLQPSAVVRYIVKL